MKSLYDYIKETVATPMNTMGMGDVTPTEPISKTKKKKYEKNKSINNLNNPASV